MSDSIVLRHTTDQERYQQIMEKGLKPRSERKEVPEHTEDQIRNNVVYLYNPEHTPDFLTEGKYGGDSGRSTMGCEVNTENLYVAKWGDSRVENTSTNNLDDVAKNYWRWKEKGTNIDIPMFLYEGEIPPDNIIEESEEKEVMKSL